MNCIEFWCILHACVIILAETVDAIAHYIKRINNVLIMFVANDIIKIELNYDYNSPLFGSMICNVLSTKQKLNKINTVTKINIILSLQASES